MSGKAPWLSKSFWVGALTIVGSVVGYFVTEVDPTVFVSSGALGVVQLIMRAVTSEPLDWSGDEK
jgi:hypothetical protein